MTTLWSRFGWFHAQKQLFVDFVQDLEKDHLGLNKHIIKSQRTSVVMVTIIMLWLGSWLKATLLTAVHLCDGSEDIPCCLGAFG